MWNQSNILDKEVTVCGTCETAACWHGAFMCDYAEMAGTKQRTVRDLWSKPRGENAEYWFKDPSTREIDRDQLASFQAATR